MVIEAQFFAAVDPGLPGDARQHRLAVADQRFTDRLRRELPPMMEREIRLSPTLISPRAWATARLAELPVPHGLRSTRPGFRVVQVRITPFASRCRNIT
jgi:hypothetical protein